MRFGRFVTKRQYEPRPCPSGATHTSLQPIVMFNQSTGVMDFYSTSVLHRYLNAFTCPCPFLEAAQALSACEDPAYVQDIRLKKVRVRQRI